IGITDYAQSALGDIVYIQLPKSASSVTANSVCGEVESTKSVSEIYAPITGTIVAVNEKLDSNPEIINSDPYGQGWIAEIEISGTSLSETLLSAQEYQSLTA
ncbi:MAG: glycine cleavage system protein, partial [Actinomycetota bacterium]